MLCERLTLRINNKFNLLLQLIIVWVEDNYSQGGRDVVKFQFGGGRQGGMNIEQNVTQQRGLKIFSFQSELKNFKFYNNKWKSSISITHRCHFNAQVKGFARTWLRNSTRTPDYSYIMRKWYYKFCNLHIENFGQIYYGMDSVLLRERLFRRAAITRGARAHIVCFIARSTSRTWSHVVHKMYIARLGLYLLLAFALLHTRQAWPHVHHFHSHVRLSGAYDLWSPALMIKNLLLWCFVVLSVYCELYGELLNTRGQLIQSTSTVYE